MIVVAVHFGAGQWSAFDDEAVGEFGDFGAELGQFFAHRCDAVGFFDAGVGDVGECGFAGGDKRTQAADIRTALRLALNL